MNRLELRVFNVGHGLSIALIERPENYITFIDLGCEGTFSPYNWLMNTEGKVPDILYITHPHADHISDVKNALCAPPKSMNYEIYDWNDVYNREQQNLKHLIREYQKLVCQFYCANYTGMARIRILRYTPKQSIANFGESNYINNSSLFILYTWKDFKIAIPGDLESSIIDNFFLAADNFKNEAINTNILVAPHHGHKSGFSNRWTNIIGKPSFTIASVQQRDPHVDSRYSKDDFAKGFIKNGVKRNMFSTRMDGNIFVDMYYKDSRPTWTVDFR